MDIKQFEIAIQSRLKSRIDSDSIGGMEVESKLRFDMEMAITGYPFELPEGADPKDYEALLTDSQYMSGKFDKAIESAHLEASKKLGDMEDYF